jgi:Lrp/AsnC family transcriptional regulator for asnA, asnC and gidA
MQVVAVTDPLTVGAYRMAMIGIKTDGDLTAVADQLSHYKEVDYVLITSGGFDVMAEVICNDDEHLLELIQRIRAIPQVRNTESFIYLKLRKQLYNWGT